METRAQGSPLLITSGKTNSLLRVEFSDDARTEEQLQKLLFEHSELLPFEELDPLFRDSVPLAREVSTDVGQIDILYVNADGLLTVVETKLWRNPEARRAVVAQLINYAAAMSKMTPQDLTRAVAVARKEEGGSLFDFVRDQIPKLNEQRFHDAVAANLRAGRFLLLVVGDGIREDVEEMGTFLDRHARMGFTLRLMEMAMYRLPGDADSLVVLPQIVARTKEIVRHIVEVRDGQIHIESPPEPAKTSGGRYKITPDQFFGEISKVVDQQTLESVKWVLSQAETHGLHIDWMQSGPVFKYYDEGVDATFTLGQFDRYGDLTELARFASHFDDLSLPDSLWHDYFSEVVKLIPGAKIKHFKSKAGNEWDDVDYGDVPMDATLPLLLRDREAWLKIVVATIEKLKVVLRQAKT